VLVGAEWVFLFVGVVLVGAVEWVFEFIISCLHDSSKIILSILCDISLSKILLGYCIVCCFKIFSGYLIVLSNVSILLFILANKINNMLSIFQFLLLFCIFNLNF